MSNNSKYPEIVIDRDTNLVNPNGFFNLTFEQFYDLMHHTHAAEDIVGEADQQESLNSLTEAVDRIAGELATAIQTLDTLNNSIQEAKDELATTQQELADTESRLTVAQNKLDEVVEAIQNDIGVSDWDVTKPGIQDENGNTIDENGNIIEYADGTKPTQEEIGTEDDDMEMVDIGN